MLDIYNVVIPGNSDGIATSGITSKDVAKQQVNVVTNTRKMHGGSVEMGKLATNGMGKNNPILHI